LSRKNKALTSLEMFFTKNNFKSVKIPFVFKPNLAFRFFFEKEFKGEKKGRTNTNTFDVILRNFVNNNMFHP